MIKWIKKIFKRKDTNEFLSDKDIEIIVKNKHEIISNNIEMITSLFELSDIERITLEELLFCIAEGNVNSIYGSDHIIRINILLYMIFYGCGSFSLAEDLCNYKMEDEEFLRRVSQKTVSFIQNNSKNFDKIESKSMKSRINIATNLLTEHINNDLSFNIYIRPISDDSVDSLFYDTNPKEISFIIANRVIERIDSDIIPLFVENIFNTNIKSLLMLLDKRRFLPIFRMDGDIYESDVIDLIKQFNYTILINTFKSKSILPFNVDYYIVCEQESINELIQRKLSKFGGHKTVLELLNNPRYQNSYYRNSINTETINYLERLFELKAIKTKDEIINSITDFISCQYNYSLKSNKSNNKIVDSSSDKNKDIYKFEYSNTDIELSKLVDSLKKNREAKLLFHGISGTGKTLFAKKLADKLNMGVKIIKCSDILRSYVGETEQLIKNTFVDINMNNTILVFDEIDSFIGNRTDSSNRWEITQTNEMLIHMEEFRGLFIGTTNRIENIDSAFHRRFDIKIKFDFMKESESISLFKQYMKIMNIKFTKKDLDRLMKLKVTPAMFSIIYKRSKFDEIKDASKYIDCIENESNYLNNGNYSKIGFLN